VALLIRRRRCNKADPSPCPAVALSPLIKIEILTPAFKGKMDAALAILDTAPPDVFNHNLETVRGLRHNVRPGADCDWSLLLLQRFKAQHPELPTKSGIMLGLGETREQVEDTLRDLCARGVNMITIGEYLRPSPSRHPVILSDRTPLHPRAAAAASGVFAGAGLLLNADS